MKKLIVCIMAVVLLFSLNACGDKKEQESNSESGKSIISLSKSNLEIEVGEEYALELTENNLKIEEGIIWGSSDNDVATVYQGVVKGISMGTATISAVYNSKTYECSVIVKKENKPEILSGDVYGQYKANPYFDGMGMNMAFELKLEKDQNQFIFKRGDVIVSGNTIKGEILETGNMEIAEGVVFLYGFDVYSLEITETINEISLTGVMPTGAPGKIFNMTFVKEKINPNKESEKEIFRTYVGANSKPAGPMGIMSGTHFINLYKDGTMDIMCGFFATMPGAKLETYKGNYTLDGDNLSFDYKVETKEYHVDTKIRKNMFRAQIFLCATMPGDDTELGEYGYTEPGYSYYEIEPTSIKNCSVAYSGTKFYKDGSYSVYVLRMYENGWFDVKVDTNKFKGIISGNYKVIEKQLEDNILTMSYKKHLVRDGLITDSIVSENADVTFESNYAIENVFDLKLLFKGTSYDEKVKLIKIK